MIDSLISFLNASPINFYAVATLEEILSANGYQKLDAANALPSLKAGDKVYFTKNDSSLYAFHIGNQSLAESGLRLICAHCDSPTFRI
jgi:aspartyl aminopeptidase